MNTPGTGGYILQAIKIYDDPTATSAMSYKYKTKKQNGTNEAEEPVDVAS